MTTVMTFLVTALLSFSLSGASPLKITRADRNGTLVWTNTLCATFPVYEVLRAQAITGPWQHVAYVTNQHAFALDNPIPAGSSAFYQIAWVDDHPVVLDYAFDEHGIGEPSVVGTLTLDLPSSSASWFFEETDLNTSEHPLGPGFGRLQGPQAQRWRIVLRGDALDDGVFLEGQLQATAPAPACSYTFSGIVYRITFAGTDPMGTFAARQR